MPQHSEATKGSSTYSKNQKLRSASDQNDCKTEPCECCSLHRLPPWIAEFHGLPEVIRSRTLAYRLFWCTVIISCMSFGGYAIYEVVAEFIESPSAASITIEPMRSLEFPSVTICPKQADAMHIGDLQEDIWSRVGRISDSETLDLIQFYLAGVGFENMMNFRDATENWNLDYEMHLQDLYEKWSRNFTNLQFFERVQREFGYRCEEFFKHCAYGGQNLTCCRDMMVEKYVMRRGRCFQVTKRNQTEADNIGKIRIDMFAPPSLFDDKSNFTQAQAIVYIGDSFDTVLDFPRYYLSAHYWNIIALEARKIELLYDKDTCSKTAHGRDARCYVQQWLRKKVESEYNCTVPYLSVRDRDLPICEPLVLVRNYMSAIETRWHSDNCLPGCKREAYDISLLQSPAVRIFENYSFNLEFSYSFLQIEHIEEVPTVTMSGFVSQIGGQLGLFVGVSAITIFQVFFYFLACSLKQCRKLLLKFGKNRSQRTIINMPASDMITNADRNLKKCPSLRNGSYSAHQKHNKIHANLEANFEDISLDNDGNDSKINSIWATSNGRPS